MRGNTYLCYRRPRLQGGWGAQVEPHGGMASVAAAEDVAAVPTLLELAAAWAGTAAKSPAAAAPPAATKRDRPTDWDPDKPLMELVLLCGQCVAR
jgi:hypothetical protein